MINKTKCILVLTIILLGSYNTAKSTPTPIVKLLTAPQAQSVMAQNSLTIISSVSTVKHGETGAIIIQGTPRTQYSIKTSYKLGNKTIPVIQWRTTDQIGVTTFNWIVSNGTTPGTYNAIISGGGNTLTTTHTVAK